MWQDERASVGVPAGMAASVGRGRQRLLDVSAALIGLCGLLALGNAAWIVVGGLPYSGPGGFAPNFGMTRAQIEAFNPELAWWALWIGATPTLLSAAFRERILFGRFDPGSIMSLIVLGLFLVGMLLPVRGFVRRT